MLVGAASARAEKRFELFTGNSVEPFLARAGRKQMRPGRQVLRRALNNRFAQDQLAFRPDVTLALAGNSKWSAVCAASKRAQSNHQRLQISHQQSRNQVSATLQKNVSRLSRRAGLNLAATRSACQHRAK